MIHQIWFGVSFRFALCGSIEAVVGWINQGISGFLLAAFTMRTEWLRTQAEKTVPRAVTNFDAISDNPALTSQRVDSSAVLQANPRPGRR
jgi:hypothetical protein